MTSHPHRLSTIRRGRTLVLAAALACVAVFAPIAMSAAQAAQASPGGYRAAQVPVDDHIEWTVAPADANGPDGRVSLRHELDPGAVATDAIAVTNLGSVTASFQVVTGDGRVGADGAFDLAPGEPADSGAWITVDGLDAGTVTLEPGETRVLPVSIAVPADALPGDHPAGIVVAVASEQDGVTVTHRIGVRLHLQVTGEIAAGLTVTDVVSNYTPSWNPFEAGSVEITYTVENTGNVRLGAADVVSVAGPFGLLEATSTASDPRELLPGDTAQIVRTLPAYPLFVLTGNVTATPVSVGEDRIALPAAAEASFSAVAIPWVQLIALVLLIVLVYLVVRWRRGAKRRLQSRIDDAVRAATATQSDDQGEVLAASEVERVDPATDDGATVLAGGSRSE